MVGYRITEAGQDLVDSYTGKRVMLWLPHVDWDVLEEMAEALCLLAFEDDYFLYDPTTPGEEVSPLMVRRLENLGCIERSYIPEIEALGRRYNFKLNHPGRFPGLFSED